MSTFFVFLAEHLIATMTSLASFLASLITIVTAVVKKGRPPETKGRYAAIAVFLIIFFISFGYLAGQYSVLSRSLADGDGQRNDTQTVSPAESEQKGPEETDDRHESEGTGDTAPENDALSPADDAEDQNRTQPVSGNSNNVPQTGAGKSDHGGVPADTSTAAVSNDKTSAAASNTSPENTEAPAGTESAAASNGGVANTGNGNTTIHNSGDNNNIIAGDGNKIEIHKESTEVPVTVSSVSLNKEELTLEVGSSQTLTATVLYSDNEQDFSVKWVSSDEAVASVDRNGCVTAVSPGFAKITAQASKNNTAERAECAVTVTSPVTAPTGYSISLSTKRVSLYSEFTVRITPYEDTVTQITVHAMAPSGQEDVFVWGKGVREKNYYIDTETGTWKIWATIENEKGVYTAGREEDFATIEITPVSLSPLLPDNILT